MILSSSCNKIKNNTSSSFIKKTIQKCVRKTKRQNILYDEDSSVTDSKLTVSTTNDVDDEEIVIRIKRIRTVRFNRKCETFEIENNSSNDTTLLWYSVNEINDMKSKISIFAEHIRKKQICHHYDNRSLEKMLNNYNNKDSAKDYYTIQGIESLVDCDKERTRSNNIKQGVNAVLRLQHKMKPQKRIIIRRNRQNKKKSFEEENKKNIAIANCYARNGNTIQCQEEANARGIEYTIAVPREVIRTRMAEI